MGVVAPREKKKRWRTAKRTAKCAQTT